MEGSPTPSRESVKTKCPYCNGTGKKSPNDPRDRASLVKVVENLKHLNLC